MDEAFLRRIQYKVFAESPTLPDFVKIWENYCRDIRVPFDRTLVERIVEQEIRPRNIALRGCQPRDLIEHALALALYLEQPRELTFDLLSQACASYFIDEREAPVA